MKLKRGPMFTICSILEQELEIKDANNGFPDTQYFRFPSRFNMATEIREIQHFSEALHLRSRVPKGSNFWEKWPVNECV